MYMWTPSKGKGFGLPKGEMERYAFRRGGFKCTPSGGEDFGPPSGKMGERGRDPVTGVVNVEQNKQELRPKENFAFLRYSPL